MLRRTLQVVCAAAVAVATCVITPLPAQAAQLEVEVDLVDGFSEKNASISTGTIVVWRNVEKIAHATFDHTVTADGGTFDSGHIVPGASFSNTFNDPGTFTYKCSLHPRLMAATLTVTGPKIEPPKLEKTVRIVEPGSSSTWTYDPNDVVGTVGLKITWRNDGAQPHNVTSEDGSLASPTLNAGQSWTHKFSAPVSLRYVCSLHTWMKGTVRIAAEGSSAPPPPPPPPPVTNKGSSQHNFGTGTPPSDDAGPTTFKVGMIEPSPSEINTWTFSPNTLSARVGDTVVWENVGAAPHTATASDKSFDTGNLGQGETYSLSLKDQGSFAYICTLHAWMKGTLVVAAAGTTPVTGPPAQDPGVPPGTGVDPGQTAGEPGTDGSDQEPVGAPVEPVRRQLALIVLLASALMTAVLAWVARRQAAPKDPASPEVIDVTSAEEPAAVEPVEAETREPLYV